jgi:hypothetical protein
MRKKGENSAKCTGKSAIPPDKIMISPLVSKVNNPFHLADFAAPSSKLIHCGVQPRSERTPPHAPAEIHPASVKSAIRGANILIKNESDYRRKTAASADVGRIPKQFFS